jgi:hypothetical protein
MMTGATPRAADAAVKDEARTNCLQLANGLVRPRTKESRSRNRSSSFRDPTRYEQALGAPPPVGQLLG